MEDSSLPARDGILLIVSGPAGSGKTTLCERLVAEFSPRLQRVITATSRAPRPGEENGRDYHFLSKDEFEKRVVQGDFYEHASVHGNHYGVLKSAVLGKLDAQADLVLNIDVQGAATFQKAEQEDPRLTGRVVSVFVLPSDLVQLRDRLRLRGDLHDDIERRLETARKEVLLWRTYDYCILTGEREADYERIRSIYISETLRTRRMSQS